MRKARPINYYIVLQSLHKTLPSTGLYYGACTKHVPVLLGTDKACTKHVPVLLGTTKLAQSTSQYLPSTTVYYKACTKYFPVLLCATRHGQSTSQDYFVHTEKLLHTHTEKLSHREALHQRSFYRQRSYFLHTMATGTSKTGSRRQSGKKRF